MTIHQAARGRVRKLRSSSVRRLRGAPQKRGVVVRLRIMSPKKPNSAKRKVAKVRLSTKAHVIARLKGQGHNLQAFSNVLVSGGRANDLPAVRFTMVKGVFDFGWQESFPRRKSRSKYGISLENLNDY